MGKLQAGEGERSTTAGSNSTSFIRSQSRFTEYQDVLESVSMTQVLRNCMKKKYGSTVAGWRAVIDCHTQCNMSFGNFNLMLENMAFGGSVRTLWKELAQQKNGPLSNSIPFQVLDPEAQKLLTQCRGQLVFNFG